MIWPDQQRLMIWLDQWNLISNQINRVWFGWNIGLRILIKPNDQTTSLIKNQYSDLIIVSLIFLPDRSSIFVFVSTELLCWPSTGARSGTMVGTAMDPAVISLLEDFTHSRRFKLLLIHYNLQRNCNWIFIKTYSRIPLEFIWSNLIGIYFEFIVWKDVR